MQPQWDDRHLKAGGMVRSALWLAQVIGEGNTFTKEQLRNTFPGVSQIDRRVRDLRDFGWIIHTNVEEGSLLPEQQRLVRIGVPVWDPRQRRAAQDNRGLTAGEARAVLDRDGHMCTSCGIGAAEPYPGGTGETAVLMVVRRDVHDADGPVGRHFVTECKRCRSGSSTPTSVADVMELISRLSDDERKRLAFWVERGRRNPLAIDRAWAGYRLLPDAGRESVKHRLSGG